jgi:TonB family protein
MRWISMNAVKSPQKHVEKEGLINLPLFLLTIVLLGIYGGDGYFMSLEEVTMRKIVLAAVALCPMLIHAQAILPAQPQSAAPNAALVSKLNTPAAPGTPAVAATPTKAAVRVSTGVTFPRLIETSSVLENSTWTWAPAETSKTAVVKLTVDEKGTPSNVQVVRSLGTAMDRDLVAAVSQYRFKPGSLNHEAIPVEVELTVKILNHYQPGLSAAE